MPRPAWLLLVLALTGPVLTHAEAADDLGRALIEPSNTCAIEVPDGGVGDDPVVVSSWNAGPKAGPSRIAPLGPGTPRNPRAIGHDHDFAPARPRLVGPGWPGRLALRLHALLRRFLI